MKKAIIFLFCIPLIIFTSCAKQPSEPKLASVNIAFQNWVGYGPFYLAQEKGFCREEGIELVFIDEQLDSSRRDAFKQGMLDFEGGTLDLLVSKTAQGTPIVAVMEIGQSFGGDAIVAAGNIRKLEDLTGKRVVLARDDVGETLLSILFYKNGLSLSGAIIIPELAEKIAKVFLAGEADACATWEPQVSEALRRPGAHILASTKDYPGIIIDTLNVRRELIENNQGLVKSLMRAWFKALKFYEKYPNEASAIIAKHYKVTPEQYRKQVEGLKWENYEKQAGPLRAKEWAKIFDIIADIKLANGRISQKPDASKFLNHELLKKLYETGQ